MPRSRSEFPVVSAFVVAACAVLGMAGCAKPPIAEIADAEAALEAARHAEAPQYAPVLYRSAESLMTETYRLNDVQEYADARTRAVETRDKANEARELALKNRAQGGAGAGAAGGPGDGGRIEGGKSAAETQAQIAAEAIGTGAMEEGAILRSLQAVYFDFDDYTIRESERAKIQTAAEWLIANGTARVRIEGHTDERGAADYNMALGSKRAESVREILSSLGVAADRLETRSYGEETPFDGGHDESAWAQNRRGEFVVLP